MNLSGLAAVGEAVERIYHIILLAPFLIALLIGGSFSLWQHNPQPLLWGLLCAIIVDAIIVAVKKIIFWSV